MEKEKQKQKGQKNEKMKVYFGVCVKCVWRVYAKEECVKGRGGGGAWVAFGVYSCVCVCVCVCGMRGMRVTRGARVSLCVAYVRMVCSSKAWRRRRRLSGHAGKSGWKRGADGVAEVEGAGSVVAI